MIVGYDTLVAGGMAGSPKRRLVINRDSKYREWSVEKMATVLQRTARPEGISRREIGEPMLDECGKIRG